MQFYEKNLPLKTFKVPVDFPAMQFYQLWHERVHQASEHKWLRELATTVACDLMTRPDERPAAAGATEPLAPSWALTDGALG